MGKECYMEFRLDGGKAVWYRNRQVEGNNANTHVISHAKKIYAIVEAGGSPVEIDQELNSLTEEPFYGTLKTGFTAHTKTRPGVTRITGITYNFPRGTYEAHHVVVGKDGRINRADFITTI